MSEIVCYNILEKLTGGAYMLYRKIESFIEEHLRSGSPKILLVDGARQVGKTYIIRHVGKKLFPNYIEINMVEDSLGARLFAETRSVEDFYLQVSMIHGDIMKEKENTLIFIDEIQAYPHLLTLLKFLSQDDKFPYIASGSLLGVTLSETTSIPMGSIRKVRMFPLDFEEFLYANGFNELAIETLKEKFNKPNGFIEFYYWPPNPKNPEVDENKIFSNLKKVMKQKKK